ncbi:unnamed protein product, partial [Prorocentrum cordatum]
EGHYLVVTEMGFGVVGMILLWLDTSTTIAEASHTDPMYGFIDAFATKGFQIDLVNSKLAPKAWHAEWYRMLTATIDFEFGPRLSKRSFEHWSVSVAFLTSAPKLYRTCSMCVSRHVNKRKDESELPESLWAWYALGSVPAPRQLLKRTLSHAQT